MTIVILVYLFLIYSVRKIQNAQYEIIIYLIVTILSGIMYLGCFFMSSDYKNNNGIILMAFGIISELILYLTAQYKSKDI